MFFFSYQSHELHKWLKIFCLQLCWSEFWLRGRTTQHINPCSSRIFITRLYCMWYRTVCSDVACMLRQKFQVHQKGQLWENTRSTKGVPVGCWSLHSEPVTLGVSWKAQLVCCDSVGCPSWAGAPCHCSTHIPPAASWRNQRENPGKVKPSPSFSLISVREVRKLLMMWLRCKMATAAWGPPI